MKFLLEKFNALLGTANVLVGADAVPYLTDWRKLRTGKALAVLRPGNTEDVSEIVRLCAGSDVSIVPQGGNTGQVAGATPDDSGDSVVLSLSRLDRIREINPENNRITVEAGCVLERVQEAAAAADRLFPLSLGAQGRCQIGGNLATNAGGTQVLCYGNARDLALGLEVVTAEGEIWHGLRGLRKDNSGYALRDLYIGSEGTLGIITAATLKLFPLPTRRHTAFLALDSLENAAALLQAAQSGLGPTLTAFEVMSRDALDLVTDVFPDQRLPFPDGPGPAAWFALIELSTSAEKPKENDLETFLAGVLENGLLLDAVIASSEAQRRALWHLRESITPAIAETGPCIKHDVSLPVSKMAAFVSESDRETAAAYPGSRAILFGHLGDGNLHYNLLAAPGDDGDRVAVLSPSVQRLVHDRVVAKGGSISAEQGIGWSRTTDLEHYKSPLEMALMRRIKVALDPKNIMNPGKILERI